MLVLHLQLFQYKLQDNQWPPSLLTSLLFSVRKVAISSSHICAFHLPTGKCYPYDPSKVKGVNLEAKPGMIIQAAPTTSPKKVNPTAAPQKGQSVPQKGHKGQGPAGQKSRGKGDDDDRGKSRQGESTVLKPDYSRQVVGSRLSVSNPLHFRVEQR